jgi:prophage maintenance system killer protein
MKNTKDILLYKSEDGKLSFEVNLNEETVWLSQKEMGELFGKDSDTIGTHLKNIYKSKELEEKSTTAKYAVVRQEGKRKVTRQIKYYNLDAIISVGYRVNSKIGTQFRIWATNIIEILKRTVETQRIGLDEATGLLKVISDYSYALDLLDAYDHQRVEITSFHKRKAYILTYEEAMRVIESMKTEFATDLFGNEKDDSFRGSLGAIYQTAFGEEVYPSIEEKGAHLLYFVVKNHSFSDGNKRIAAAIFIYFMEANKILYRENGSKRIADNTLVAITLMIAESKPTEKDTIVKVLVNLINENN